MVKKKLLMFITALVIGAGPFMTIGYSVYATSSEIDNQASTLTESIPINSNLSLEVTTETYPGYEVITVTDNQGNISVSDSRQNYVLENGKKIGITINESTGLIPPTLKSVPAWQYVRTNTVTVAFDKAIKDLAIGTLLAKAKAVLGIVYSAVSVIKAAYEKPDLRASKAFYLQTNTYGKTNHLNYNGRHIFSLDAKKRKIKHTDYFSDIALKNFLGYK